MIARIWHGWTTRGNADIHETLLITRVLALKGHLNMELNANGKAYQMKHS